MISMRRSAEGSTHVSDVGSHGIGERVAVEAGEAQDAARHVGSLEDDERPVQGRCDRPAGVDVKAHVEAEVRPRVATRLELGRPVGAAEPSGLRGGARLLGGRGRQEQQRGQECEPTRLAHPRDRPRSVIASPSRSSSGRASAQA